MDTEGVCQCKGAADTDGRSGEIENANAESFRGQICSSSVIIDRSISVLPKNYNIDNKPAERAGLVHF